MGNFGGGSPFGRDGHPWSETKTDVRDDRLYKILGVSRDASDVDIKKAHRQLALVHHPDKGGDAEEFKSINHAFGILKDPNTRRVYDDMGEEGLEMGMGDAAEEPVPFPFPFQGPSSKRRTTALPTVMEMNLSLEEIFKGVTKKLRITKNKSCDTCDETGSKSGRRTPCGACAGKGVRIQIHRPDPRQQHLVLQSMAPCEVCCQTGEAMIESEMECRDCQGSGLISQTEVIEIRIETGLDIPSRHVLVGKGGVRKRGEPAGDLHIMIRQIPHQIFQRVGPHLVTRKRVGLREALCGTVLSIVTLDGRKIMIPIKSPNQVLIPETILKVDEEGMTSHGGEKKATKGQLFICVKVEFPERIDEEDIGQLRKILPSSNCAGDSELRWNAEGPPEIKPQIRTQNADLPKNVRDVIRNIDVAQSDSAKSPEPSEYPEIPEQPGNGNVQWRTAMKAYSETRLNNDYDKRCSSMKINVLVNLILFFQIVCASVK